MEKGRKTGLVVRNRHDALRDARSIFLSKIAGMLGLKNNGASRRHFSILCNVSHNTMATSHKRKPPNPKTGQLMVMCRLASDHSFGASGIAKVIALMENTTASPAKKPAIGLLVAKPTDIPEAIPAEKIERAYIM